MNAKIKRLLSRTATAGDLIALLQDLDPETLVAFSSDYGDHCHTQQVHLISGEIDKRSVCESAYSVSDLALEDEDDEDEAEESEPKPTVYIIS